MPADVEKPPSHPLLPSHTLLHSSHFLSPVLVLLPSPPPPSSPPFLQAYLGLLRVRDTSSGRSGVPSHRPHARTPLYQLTPSTTKEREREREREEGGEGEGEVGGINRKAFCMTDTPTWYGSYSSISQYLI